MVRRILAIFLVGIITTTIFRPALGDVVVTTPQPAGLRMIESNSDGVILQLDTHEFRFEEQTIDGIRYQRLMVPGADGSDVPGGPDLPQFSALLGAPDGAKIDLEIINDDAVQLAGSYRLAPAPSPLALVEDFTPGEMAYRPDPASYRSQDYFPTKPVQLAEEAWMRDWRVIRVVFAPFQYNAAAGRLMWHKVIKVKISFVGGINTALAGAENTRPDPYDFSSTWRFAQL